MDLLRRAFGDISRGYSSGLIAGRAAFVRHLSYSDQIDLDARYDALYQQAHKDGIKTNEEKLAELKESGQWSDAKEKEIADIKETVRGMHDAKRKNLKQPSLVKQLARKIAEEEKRYADLVAEKYALLGLTCETYADSAVNDYYICRHLYEDCALTRPLYDESSFDYLTPDEIGALIVDYKAAIEPCTDAGIRKLAMQGFFQRYFGLVGDSLDTFFGKPICFLTFNQVELLRWAVHFRHIYSSHDVSTFPKDVVDDPELLTDYAAAADKGKADMQKQGAYAENTIVMGMNKEDAKATGVKGDNDLLKNAATKHGGNVIEALMAQKR